MKKIILPLVLFVMASCTVCAFDLKDLIGGKSSDSEENTESAEGKSGNGILDAIGGFVQNVTANKNFTVDDLVGTWAYTSPAVTFQSDDALKKIGGAGAAGVVESKLEPYYEKFGLDQMELTVESDHTFTMKVRFASLKGTIEKDDEGMLEFTFSAFGKVKLGTVKASATKSMNTLNLTFDAQRLIAILDKVASVAKVSTLSTLSQLLSSYDGIYMGFKLKQTAKGSATSPAAAETDNASGSGESSSDRASSILERLGKAGKK